MPPDLSKLLFLSPLDLAGHAYDLVEGGFTEQYFQNAVLLHRDHFLTLCDLTERDLGRSINPTVYSPKEFKAKLQERNHFLKSVMRGEKVLLIGDENELGKMG